MAIHSLHSGWESLSSEFVHRWMKRRFSFELSAQAGCVGLVRALGQGRRFCCNRDKIAQAAGRHRRRHPQLAKLFL